MTLAKSPERNAGNGGVHLSATPFDPELSKLTETQFLQALQNLELAGRQHQFSKAGNTWNADAVRWGGVPIAIGFHFGEDDHVHTIDMGIERYHLDRFRQMVFAILGHPTSVGLETLGSDAVWATTWELAELTAHFDVPQNSTERAGMIVFFKGSFWDAPGHAEVS